MNKKQRARRRTDNNNGSAWRGSEVLPGRQMGEWAMQGILALFRRKPVIVTRASSGAQRKAVAKREQLHAQLARECGRTWKGNA